MFDINVINLSGRVLSEAEISLLSKGLKFCSTPHGVNKAVLKEELEVFGRRLRFAMKKKRLRIQKQQAVMMQLV